MKRVAHFIDTHNLGGAEVIVIEICKRLSNYGFKPAIFHFGNPWLDEKCKSFNIPSFLVPGKKYYKTIKSIPLFYTFFYRFLKQQKIDILHSHLVDPIIGSCVPAFLTKTSHIGTLHDTHTIEERKLKIVLLQAAAMLGTRLITVSDSMEQFFQNISKFPRGNFRKIRNGVDLDKFTCAKNKQLRSELKLDYNDIVLICVGRLAQIKGHEILIQAFSNIKSHFPVKLLIVGDGPELQKIKTLIAKMEMGNNIKLLGERDDVPELLGLSDCFVLSSHSEGLSCSIIEAMAAGLPVLATNVGGNSELIKNNESGYLIPPNDPLAYADKLQGIIDDENKRRAFGEKSLEIAKIKFSIDKTVNDYVRLYNEVVLRK